MDNQSPHDFEVPQEVTVLRAPVSVLIPCKNEEANLANCLRALHNWASEIVVVDSNSDDGSVEIARTCGATTVQFAYSGGWPKKRQWAIESHSFKNDWILLLDADEILSDDLKAEITAALAGDAFDGYHLRYNIHFLNRTLCHGDTELWKLALFRRGKGCFECRLADQDMSMGDMEVHEHFVVNGRVGRLRSPVFHCNSKSLADYIAKHNTYSNWEAALYASNRGSGGDLHPSLSAQARRRRLWKRKLLESRWFPVMTFLYSYILKLGFLDGTPGFFYSALRAVQMFHVQAKVYESRLSRSR
jgi:glycosyltransferase involved in cell wall biosynthesis